MTIALLIEEMLIDLGHKVTALAMRLPQGLDLARDSEIDFAILDVNLDGRMSFLIADVLSARGVPFIFATGYGAAGVDAAYGHHIVMKKPFEMRDLADAINIAAAA